MVDIVDETAMDDEVLKPQETAVEPAVDVLLPVQEENNAAPKKSNFWLWFTVGVASVVLIGAVLLLFIYTEKTQKHRMR